MWILFHVSVVTVTKMAQDVRLILSANRTRDTTSKLKSRVKVEVAVLVEVAVPNKRYGFYGSKATLNLNIRAQELCEK